MTPGPEVAAVTRPGGPLDRLARRLGDRPPVAVFGAALVAGLLATTVVSIALGLFVVHVLVGSLGLGAADDGVVETLAAHRTATLNGLASIATAAGGGTVLPLVAGPPPSAGPSGGIGAPPRSRCSP